MQIEPPCSSRTPRTVRLEADLVVVGGGMAGVCAAITAARQDLKVVLVQDRPVLGGNASSEIRLWVLGATTHMGSNNRWSREGGVIGEIMVENLHRNPEGNPLIFDTVVLEKVVQETNLTLLLNTAAFEVLKPPGDPDRIAGVRAFCAQNSVMYEVFAPLFCDSSGDGILGFLAGAAFRVGAESPDAFDEPFAPTGDFGHLLGHSLYFYSKDVGQPVRFTAPSFALKDIEGRIPRYRSFNAREHGCRLWWIEWGGRLDTVHETERIKWELWKVVYGVWDYIKNSGRFPEAANLTLEWVGAIPGKRESRRFEGPCMLAQRDVVQRRSHADAVAHGGWSIDLHPADGVFSDLAGSHHLHATGVYAIPYRCYYSRNIPNLFFAGRIISASHVAFGTTRVMATCAVGAQAVAVAAALCRRNGWQPAEISASPQRVHLLQQELLKTGQFIPGVMLEDPDDLARQADITASSELKLGTLGVLAGASGAPSSPGPLLHLTQSHAQLLPVLPGPMPRVTLEVQAIRSTTLRVELRAGDRPDSYTPGALLAVREEPVAAKADVLNTEGSASLTGCVTLDFTDVVIDQPRYVFLCAMANEDLRLRCANERVTGLVTVRRQGSQQGMEERGGETFEFWPPPRRPAGHNFALRLEPPIAAFAPVNVANGFQRPTAGPNAWVAALDDPAPTLTLRWPAPRTIGRVELAFDVDFDHAMESVLFGHPERAMPFCVKDLDLLDATGQVIAALRDNHEALRTLRLAEPVTTDRLDLVVRSMNGQHSPAAIFAVRCYARQA